MNAVAEMLGVYDPEPVITASQSVIDLEDDTDLEAAAQFNLEQWLDEAQVSQSATSAAKAARDTELPTVLR